jgi:hypothetical protein
MTLKHFAVIIDALVVVTIFLIIFSAKDTAQTALFVKKILQLIVFEISPSGIIFFFLTRVYSFFYQTR